MKSVMTVVIAMAVLLTAHPIAQSAQAESVESSVGPSLCRFLDAMTLEERFDTRLEICLPFEASLDQIATKDQIEELWDAGHYDRAVEIAQELNDPELQERMEITVTWITPILTGTSDRWGTDVRVGLRGSAYVVDLDVHRPSGALFCVYVYEGEGAASAVALCMSFDGGNTWYQHTAWASTSSVSVLNQCIISDEKGLSVEGHFAVDIPAFTDYIIHISRLILPAALVPRSLGRNDRRIIQDISYSYGTILPGYGFLKQRGESYSTMFPREEGAYH